MKVILLEKVSKLGNIGETVKVKDGYARNYLIPYKAAIRATEENIKVFESKKVKLEEANLEKIKVAKKQLISIPKTVSISREASEQGALFGSVTSRDLVKLINVSEDINLAAKDIILKTNIKTLGTFSAKVIFHPEVTTNIEIIVKNTEESVSKK